MIAKLYQTGIVVTPWRKFFTRTVYGFVFHNPRGGFCFF